MEITRDAFLPTCFFFFLDLCASHIGPAQFLRFQNAISREACFLFWCSPAVFACASRTWHYELFWPRVTWLMCGPSRRTWILRFAPSCCDCNGNPIANQSRSVDQYLNELAVPQASLGLDTFVAMYCCCCGCVNYWLQNTYCNRLIYIALYMVDNMFYHTRTTYQYCNCASDRFRFHVICTIVLPAHRAKHNQKNMPRQQPGRRKEYT